MAPPNRPLPARVPPSLPAVSPRRDLAEERHHRSAEGPNFKGPLWVVAVLSALALILSAGIFQFIHKSSGGAPSTADAPGKRAAGHADSSSDPLIVTRFPVAFEANVPDTRFSENGLTLKPASELSAGDHMVEASHDGYLPEVKTFTVDPATGNVVKFELRPILPLLRVTSSIAHGRLVVDERESLDLQAGVATKEDLTPGLHTVKIFDAQRQVFAFAFEAKPNAMPSLVGPLGNQPEPGLIVSSLAGSAKVYATNGLRAAAAPPVAPVPNVGLLVSGSATNPAHFLLDAGKGKGPQEQSVDPSIFPTLKVQLADAPEATYLAITANAGNCQTYVDGKLLVLNASGDAPSVPLDPGSHPVRLSCPGFQDLEKVAVVKPGEVSPHKLDFVMTPVPAAPVAAVAPVAPAPVRHAQLMLTGAPPDTPVFQNQIRIGTVGADGTFTREIEPGTFTWEWRKAGYEPRRETQTVKAGDAVKIDGAMVASTGTLRVKVVPDGAQISVRRESDNAAFNPSNNMLLSLAPGVYAVTAQAPQYRDRAESVTVPAGKIVTLDWGLDKMAVPSVPVRFFENGESWTPLAGENGWWIHPGSGYSALRASTGVVNIDFLRKKRSRKINILADCRDHANCIVYSIDGHNFTTKVVAGGDTLSDEKKAHGMDDNSSFHLVFEMSPAAIVVKNHAGAVLSSVERKDPRGKLTIQDDTPLNVN